MGGSLILDHVAARMKRQKLSDYQRYRHRMPELHKLIHMHGNIKQASFLNQASILTSASGFTRCKENLIETKLKNQDKMKLKYQELQHQESEVKAMKFMITQKSNAYQVAKKRLEELRRANKALNIDQMKADLFQARKAEMVALVDANLLAALYIYYHTYRKNLKDSQIIEDASSGKNLHLLRLKLA